MKRNTRQTDIFNINIDFVDKNIFYQYYVMDFLLKYQNIVMRYLVVM